MFLTKRQFFLNVINMKSKFFKMIFVKFFHLTNFSKVTLLIKIWTLRLKYYGKEKK